MALRVKSGGSGGDLLVLLHGLGSTGDIWRDVDRHWSGRWVAPDLPGHGGSDPLPTYSFESMASGVQDLVNEHDAVVVLGHSLGGVLGLVMAASTPQVRRVVGLGIKVHWTDEELAKARALGERPVAWFDTREAAIDRHRRIAGLGELVDDEVAACGVCEQDGQWRLALDPAAFTVGAPDMPRLLASCPVPVTLARGERDHMVTQDQLTELVPSPVTLPGLGHNAHLEDPAAVFALL